MADVQSTYEKALDLLDEGELLAAEELGHFLVESHFSGGFEIVGRCLFERGEKLKAVQVLQDGVRMAPEVWPLWLQLAAYLSHLEVYDEALRCYTAARECPSVDPVEIDLNEAVVRLCMDEPEVALELCRQVRQNSFDEASLAVALEYEIRALVILERFAQASVLIDEKATQEWQKSGLFAEVARGLLDAGQRAEALTQARRALELRRTGEAWNVVRLVEGERSPSARAYHLVFEGIWDQPSEDGEELGFFTDYHVVADNEGEAVATAIAIERPALRDRMQLDSLEIQESLPGAPKGVVRVGSFIFFRD